MKNLIKKMKVDFANDLDEQQDAVNSQLSEMMSEIRAMRKDMRLSLLAQKTASEALMAQRCDGVVPGAAGA